MVGMFKLLYWALDAIFRPRNNLLIENISLRQQLIVYQRSVKRPKIKDSEILSRILIFDQDTGYTHSKNPPLHV